MAKQKPQGFTSDRLRAQQQAQAQPGWVQDPSGNWQQVQPQVVVQVAKKSQVGGGCLLFVVIAALVIFGLAVLGSSSSSKSATSTSAPAPAEATTTTEARSGNVEVYRRIDAMTTREQVQAEFDVAMENVNRREPGDPYRALSLDYAEYALDRQKALGCP